MVLEWLLPALKGEPERKKGSAGQYGGEVVRGMQGDADAGFIKGCTGC
jgi:hypothetical protein